MPEILGSRFHNHWKNVGESLVGVEDVTILSFASGRGCSSFAGAKFSQSPGWDLEEVEDFVLPCPCFAFRAPFLRFLGLLEDCMSSLFCVELVNFNDNRF